MAVIVQKYGGTSVGSLSRIEAVAEQVIDTVRQGHQVVVVLSAMSGETNRLTALAQQLDPVPASRELDVLLATGEQVSISLMAIALVKRGISAISLLAHQIGIKTDNHFGAARIKHVDEKRLGQALEQEQVVIVAGFQGQDRDNNITTLGRGGSDTSAVAIAVAVKAAEVQIFTDVDGVYSGDPRIIPKAKRLDAVSFSEMLEMANLGAKVLQNRAVEYAKEFDMPIRVLSSFEHGEGTLVTTSPIETLDKKSSVSAHRSVSSVVCLQKRAIASLPRLKDCEYLQLKQELNKQGVEFTLVDPNKYQLVEVENSCDCHHFVISSDKIVCLKSILEEITSAPTSGSMRTLDGLAQISVICIEPKKQETIASKLLSILTSAEISTKLISTSATACSAVIDESDLINAMRILHSGFGLDSLP